MKRINSQDTEDVELAKQVLSWISYAKRPLTVIELRHALAIVPEAKELDVEALMDKELLLSVCAGIVTIEHGSDIMRLVHYTTQEYFERKRDCLFPDAQTTIASSCLTYLAFNVFDKPCTNKKSLEDRLKEYKLSVYAAQYWGAHTRGHAETKMGNAIIQTFQSRGKLDSIAQIERHELKPWDFAIHSGLSLLHIVAANGLATICQYFLNGTYNVSVDPDARDKDGGTALICAATNGHDDVVKRLVDAGADLEASVEYGGQRCAGRPRMGTTMW